MEIVEPVGAVNAAISSLAFKVQQNMVPRISVSSISERDVDLLLLEEFVASASFGSWIVVFEDRGKKIKRMAVSNKEVVGVVSDFFLFSMEAGL